MRWNWQPEKDDMTAVSIGDEKMFGLLSENYQDLNHALELAAGRG